MAVMAEGGTPVRDLAWLLDDLSDREADFRRAVILSRDGLLIAASKDLSREDGEHLSAVAAAVQSLAAGTGDRFAAGGGGGPGSPPAARGPGIRHPRSRWGDWGAPGRQVAASRIGPGGAPLRRDRRADGARR